MGCGKVKLIIGTDAFDAILEEERAPRTCAWLLGQLPFRNRLIHVRWSGEACWVPMGMTPVNVPWEEATRHPRPGQLILYPGGVSETELLMAYGAVAFASKAGPLAGNPVLTLESGVDRLADIGRSILWSGARDFQVQAV